MADDIAGLLFGSSSEASSEGVAASSIEVSSDVSSYSMCESAMQASSASSDDDSSSARQRRRRAQRPVGPGGATPGDLRDIPPR